VKGSRLPHEARMFPRQRPAQRAPMCCRKTAAAFRPNYLHQSWRDFLYWDTELEQS